MKHRVSFLSTALLCLLLRRLLVYGMCVCVPRQFGSIYVDGSHLRHNLEVRLDYPKLPSVPSKSSHANALHCLCVLRMVHLCMDVAVGR